jgi:hypothetical protein
VATTTIECERRGWLIESRPYEASGDRWRPRARVSRLDGGRICTHDVRAVLSLTFETAQAADEYAVRMAKAWIEERDYQPLATPSRSSRGDADTAPSEA